MQKYNPSESHRSEIGKHNSKQKNLYQELKDKRNSREAGRLEIGESSALPKEKSFDIFSRDEDYDQFLKTLRFEQRALRQMGLGNKTNTSTATNRTIKNQETDDSNPNLEVSIATVKGRKK